MGTYDEKSKEYRGGFCPIAFARTARAPVQLKVINWKMGKKSTGGAKVETPEFIEKNDMAEVVFAPKGPDRRHSLQGVRRSRPCRHHGLQRACHARQGRQVLLQVMMGQSCELQ